MKSFGYKKILLAVAVASVSIYIGCNDSEYQEFEARAYISEAIESTSEKVTIPNNGDAEMTLNVSLSHFVDQDSHYSFVADQSVLDEFNRVNGTNYIILPENQYVLPGDVIVKAGEYSSGGVSVGLKQFSEEMMKSGESYALPLRLVAKNSSVEAMPVTGTFVVLAESILEFSAPMFTGSADLKADLFGDTPEIYPEYTIEVRFQVSDTGDRDRAIFKNGGDESNFVLLRFEDPQSDNENHKAHSLVQVVGRDRLYLNPSYSFEPDKWQHLALTCNGSSYKLYINGMDGGILEIPSGPTTFSDVNWFCPGDGVNRWRNCKILISEARIWSVCRTEAQIKNNMTMTSPKSKGLEAYWRMNEGSGNVFEDCTGNGHTLRTSKTPKWIDGILSTDPSTKWE